MSVGPIELLIILLILSQVLPLPMMAIMLIFFLGELSF